MNTPNLKKLITGFLLLAFLATSLSLIFSAQENSRENSIKNDGLARETAQQKVPQNALTETLPLGDSVNGERTAFLPPVSNLTENLSATLAEQIIAANPSGPLPLGATTGAEAPTDEALITAVNQLINNPQTIAQVLSSLPKDSPLPAPKNIIHAPTVENISDYINSLDAIFGPEIALHESPNNSADSFEAVSALDGRMSEWIVSLQKLPVPEQFVPLHLAILNLLHTTTYFSQTALDANSDDPLKQLVLVQAGSQKVDEAVKRYNDETAKVEGILKQFSLSPTDIKQSNAHLIANLFSIQKAYAFSWKQLLRTVINALKKALAFVGGALGCVAVHTAATADDVVGGVAGTLLGSLNTAVPVKNGDLESSAQTTAVHASTIESFNFKECLLKIVTDIVKDRLIHKLVQQTIQWVQGGRKGKPQFVSNWKGFLADAGNKAAGDAINRIAPGLCRSWAPLIRVQLESTFLADTPVTCTLDQVVANAKAFYNDFSQGGWAGYGAAILPSGNYFGQLFEGSQIVAMQQFADKEAAKADAESGKGFLSTALCISYDMLSPFDVCVDRAIESCEAKQDKTIDCASGARASCAGKSTVEEKICRPGGNLLTTPGSAVGQVVNDALGAPIHRIVSAQDITALITAFINSGLNSLTKLKKGGKDDGKPNESGLLGISLSATAQAGIDQCAEVSGSAQLKCLQKISVGDVQAPPLPPIPTNECGDATHCTCNTEENPSAASLQYGGAVSDAQSEVAQNPSASGLDPGNPSRILNYGTYHKAVVCNLRTKGFSADHDGEELNVAKQGDDFQENFDISTAGGETWLGEMAVCSSKNGDNAYPNFTSAPKVTCP